MSKVFEWPVRVYYEDTDAGGLVYHARYLNFLERARTEWLRAGGFEQDALARDPGVLFAVHRAELDYLRPALFNDRLLVLSRVEERRRVSLTFAQEIRRPGDGATLLSARVRVACLDARRHRPSPIPEPVLRFIENEF